MKKDGKGLVNYQLENRGHTEEWVELCKQFETFWKKVKIPVTLNLDDLSIYIKESTMNKKGMIWNFNEGRDQSIYFDKLADLVFDILEPRSDSGDYENLYKRALRAYQSHKRINLNNYEKDLLSQTVNINSSDSELETINFFTRGHCFYTREVDGIHYKDNSGYDTLVEDFKFRAKVGNKYLNGHSLSKTPYDFECREEPTQIINQMKRGGVLPKNTKAKIIKLKERNLYDDLYKQKINGMVSPKDKWNLKMDIESLRKKLVDLQMTASQLPDEYVKEVCDFDSYPLDLDIDNDQELNMWCTDVEEFLDDSLSFKENRRLKEGESYFGKNYNWYTPKPLARVPDEFTDAYEWVFAKIGNRTFWKTNGDAVGNPFKSNSDSVAQQVGFLDFEKASYDFDVMTKFTFNFDKGKEVYPIFEEPEKALKYYQKYNVREVLEELGYSTTSIDALEIYLEEVNDN